MVEKMTQYCRCLAGLVLLVFLFGLWGCSPAEVTVRELTYRPSPSDPYRIWMAYVTDSGLLYLCGSVDNGRKGIERVDRVYNLELRLEDTLLPPRSDAIQTIKIDEHPSLQMTKGYLSDLCQFDKKRAKKKPQEKNWLEIFMSPGDKGYIKVYRSDVRAGRLPNLPMKHRAAIYQVRDSNPPEYIFMGRLRKDGPEQRVLLVLGSKHIEAMW